MAPHNLSIKLFSEKVSAESPFVPKNSTKLIKRNEEFPDHNAYQLLNAYYVPNTTLGASTYETSFNSDETLRINYHSHFLDEKMEAQKLSKLFQVT